MGRTGREGQIGTTALTYIHCHVGSDGQESACQAGGPASIPGLGIFPEEGTGNPLQYSLLENLIGRGAWRAMVHGVAKSRTQLSD